MNAVRALTSPRVLGALSGVLVVLTAFSGCEPRRPDVTTSSSSSAMGAGGAAASSSSTGGGGVAFPATASSSTGTGPPCIHGGPDDDRDGDGFTPDQGDCEDCDSNQNPLAMEVATHEGESPEDEDCDTLIDEVEPPCDDGLAIADADPLAAARALDLCKQAAAASDWGLSSARWILPDGSDAPTWPELRARYDLGHGLLPAFGPNVSTQRGARLLALSSGTARRPNDGGFKEPMPIGFDKGFSSGAPEGFPKESPACGSVVTGGPHDGAALEVVIRAPSNATGLSFDFAFYTSEWPQYVCSAYNDFFVAELFPFPAGQPDGNISFDTMGNPISVNNAWMDVCGCFGNPPSPCTAGIKEFDCALGNLPLVGTGFGVDTSLVDHAATPWLRSTAPASPMEEIRLRWSIYDSADGMLDSTVLLDDFRWIATPGTYVGTTPIPR
jgi:hypothetical protein